MSSKRGVASALDQQPAVAIALTRTSVGSGGTLACLRAMTYLAARQRLRQLRGLGMKPWGLLGFTIAIALLAFGEILALRHLGSGSTLNLRPIDHALRFVPLLLPFLLWRAAGRSPMRLQVEDVSWLLTAPGGPRAIVCWKLVLRPLAYAFVGFLSTLLARWWSGLPPAARWEIVPVGLIVGLTIRLASIGGHIVTVRAHAGKAVRIVSVIWGLALLAAALVRFPGRDWLDLHPIVDRLVAATLDPGTVSGGWLLTVLVMLLVPSDLARISQRAKELQSSYQAP
ncbi:MAG: hypothetical protein ACR2JC_06585 [Chloroflexota bacterium]